MAINDATACCQQTIVFDLYDDLSYPVNYPKTGTNIVVAGRFGIYKEAPIDFYCLKDAIII